MEPWLEHGLHFSSGALDVRPHVAQAVDGKLPRKLCGWMRY